MKVLDLFYRFSKQQIPHMPLQLANDTRYGLSAAVCTTNVERGAEFAAQFDVAMTPS